MYLIKEEKRVLYKFLLLFLGSAFILFTVIAYLFYQNSFHFFYDKTQTTMQIEASKLSAQIIHAHMSKQPISLEEIIQTHKDRIGFYDKQNRAISSRIDVKVDFSKHIYQDNEKMILIDKGTFGHLSVDSIVVERDGLLRYMEALREQIILTLLGVYIVIAVIGYFLAKAFIKPIQMKRLQLNNFIKDSTHELNTPITALMLSVNSPLPQTPKNLERIKLSAERISTIHKDLTYLLLQEIQPDTYEKKLLLNAVVKEQMTYLILVAQKKQVSIRVIYHSQIYFQIDKESFIRLFHNLLSNAIKYNKTHGSITVILENRTLSIEDTGIGIAKEDQKEIYERFYRVGDQVGGFGLGLNIVHKIVKAYGIEIKMESKLDYGTTFSLTFS